MDDPTLGPPRILDDGDASPLGRTVLSSAAGDGPDASRRAAAARRLGIAATALLAGGEVSGASVAGTIAWWKLGLLVTVIGGAIGIGIARWPDAPEPPLAVPAPQITSAVEPPPPPPVTHVAPDTVEAAITTPPAPVVAPEPPPVVASKQKHEPKHDVVKPAEPAPVETVEPAPPAPPAPPPVQIDTRRLAAEVAVLDRARAALRAGDGTAALAALDEHAREFSDGALVAEAEVVRIETLIHNRQSAAARERAASFLSRFPQSPLARRVRSLLDRLKETP
ncbi:MAG TPA: hypothetical protein VFQ53_22585 [Kofleriaceae bacterium]|nr:hypothetical protein [Kofleriaceae bacterium]